MYQYCLTFSHNQDINKETERFTQLAKVASDFNSVAEVYGR
jgi:hypothetical protein